MTQVISTNTKTNLLATTIMINVAGYIAFFLLWKSGLNLSVQANVVSATLTGPAVQHPRIAQEPSNVGPTNMQFNAMNHDGEYSFGYAGVDSSREETRQLDGSVNGKYSYISPEGKFMVVKYTADALNGFKAVGTDLLANNLRQQQLSSLPKKSLAVWNAKQQFLETYASELARINGGHRVVSVPVSLTKDEHLLAGATIHQSPATQTHSHSFATSTKLPLTLQEPEGSTALFYSFAGFDNNRHAFQQEQIPMAQQHGNVQVSKGPAYFYYVGVGDTPYYVTYSPVSVRATELGAIPADAIHDAQVPRRGLQGVGNIAKATPPVYVEYGKDYQLPNRPAQQTFVEDNGMKITDPPPAAAALSVGHGNDAAVYYPLSYLIPQYYGYRLPMFIY